jgi:hypothetical protein
MTVPCQAPSGMEGAKLQGMKYFQVLQPFLGRLHDVGTARDKAGNRRLHFDQYTALLLLYFYNPVLTSLRGIGQASDLPKVQELTGLQHASLGSLSEATGVFDAASLRSIVQELSRQALPLEHGPDAQVLRDLTVVDGTLLPALPRMLWALWTNPQHRAAKLHLQFDVLKGVPSDATLTAANGSEAAQLQGMLAPDHFYVLDRGYESYQLLRAILDIGSSFLVRVKDNVAFGLARERPLTDAARAAGVVRDLELFRLGVLYGAETIRHTLRLVVVRRPLEDGSTEDAWLVTDRLDLAAELVALAYRYRWTVELFFRWFKCILGCRHLLALDANGVAIQCYVALIASVLITLWSGRKPSKRTWEMLQLYVLGWATLEDLEAHFAKLKARENAAKARKKAAN